MLHRAPDDVVHRARREAVVHVHRPRLPDAVRARLRLLQLGRIPRQFGEDHLSGVRPRDHGSRSGLAARARIQGSRLNPAVRPRG